MLRRELQDELGFPVPEIPVTWNCALSPTAYAIEFNNVTVGTGEVCPDHLLVRGPREILDNFEGKRGFDPVTCSPALWVALSSYRDVRLKSLPVADEAKVITVSS